TAHIVQEVGERGNRVVVGDKGGFDADYILGGDKKTPVVVENNTTWNIAKSIKGKTKRLRYKDRHGNKFNMTGTNSNQGKFDWTDQTSFYFRSERGNRVVVGDKGGFDADYILGGDKKTPVVVENNTTWNIAKSIKGKTKRLRYKDRHGNKFNMTGTNSNQGKFDWTDQTSFYF